MKENYTFRDLYKKNEKSIALLKFSKYFSSLMVLLCGGVAVYSFYKGNMILTFAQTVLAIANLILVNMNRETLKRAYRSRERILKCVKTWGWDA